MAPLLLLAAATLTALTPHPDRGERTRRERHAAAPTIVRDDWGIALVHAHTDVKAKT